MENFLDLLIYGVSRLIIAIVTMTLILAMENIWLGVIVFCWMIVVIITKKYLW